MKRRCAEEELCGASDGSNMTSCDCQLMDA